MTLKHSLLALEQFIGNILQPGLENESIPRIRATEIVFFCLAESVDCAVWSSRHFLSLLSSDE